MSSGTWMRGGVSDHMTLYEVKIPENKKNALRISSEHFSVILNINYADFRSS
jgi:hypothetical protein